MLVGEIGIDHHTALHDLRHWQILAIIRGYRKREAGNWRIVRWQSWIICRLMGAKDLERPTDLIELPDDIDMQPDEISEEDYNDALAIIRKANAATVVPDGHAQAVQSGSAVRP